MQLQISSSSNFAPMQTSAGSQARMQCTCRAVKRSSTIPATSSDHSSRQASRFAASLSAVFIASSVMSPVAFAEEPELVAQVSTAVENYKAAKKQGQAAADEAFKNSSTLKQLLEKSEANKAKNKREIQNKYCYRQAELGIGDCGGLRYIPGMTKNGKQKTPEWMQKVLGVEVPKVEGEGKTIEQLLGPNPDSQ